MIMKYIKNILLISVIKNYVNKLTLLKILTLPRFDVIIKIIIKTDICPRNEKCISGAYTVREQKNNL